ncbi:MAG: Asp-tRNA(Asn)/Glu-tRNA(Gln) amidotransferase subunit GatC [bacterium]|nr:Asp-tRNA(Asn)/Glu-tRNA(Gln) amidotransferase subunit GatC [bacterium]
MPSLISKKTLEYLAELARVKFDGHSEEKLLADLARILDYFAELNEVSTEGVLPMTGGTRITNATRRDGEALDDDLGKGVGAFPEAQGGFLKVPSVF